LPIGSGAQAFSILGREGAIHAFASLESADPIRTRSPDTNDRFHPDRAIPFKQGAAL
jgi:hypothetical protein